MNQEYNKNQIFKHTLAPPISSTETESTYPRSSGFGRLSFNCSMKTKIRRKKKVQ